MSLFFIEIKLLMVFTILLFKGKYMLL